MAEKIITLIGTTVTKQLNKNQHRYTNEVTKSQPAIGAINSVIGTFYFSGYGYGKAFTVTASLCSSRPTSGAPAANQIIASVTQTVQMNAGDGSFFATFNFGSGFTAEQINSIKYFHFTSSSNVTETNSSGSSYPHEIYIHDTPSPTVKVICEGSNVFYGNSTWKNCQVYYGTSTGWKPCTVYFGKDGTWKQV